MPIVFGRITGVRVSEGGSMNLAKPRLESTDTHIFMACDDKGIAEHGLNGACWCAPQLNFVSRQGNEVWVHRVIGHG